MRGPAPRFVGAAGGVGTGVAAGPGVGAAAAAWPRTNVATPAAGVPLTVARRRRLAFLPSAGANSFSVRTYWFRSSAAMSV